MKIVISEEVTVITPTTGNDCLFSAIDSVARQDYPNIKHLIVADGPNVKVKHDFLTDVVITNTPWNTGANGFYGHRIYAAYPQLITSTYTAFLDDDNWYAPDHISSLVCQLEKNSNDWVHSLRKVYLDKEDGSGLLGEDNCEAIGRWPIWFTRGTQQEDFLVDTSCYLFRTEFLRSVSHFWNWGWGADRRFFNIIHKQLGHENFSCSGKYTLNYKLPPLQKAYGGNRNFFDQGNKATLEAYGDYPWKI